MPVRMGDENELSRVIQAGPPPDGDMAPLFRAISRAEVWVPVHVSARGSQPVVFAQPRRDGPGETKHVSAYTDRELAARSSGKLPLERMPLKRACRFAAFNRLDELHIDRGGWGYAMSYGDMVNLLAGMAPNGRGETIVFGDTGVPVRYEVPAARPPAGLLDTIASLAKQLGIRHLAWCSVTCGEAPAEMCVAYAPFENAAFELELHRALMLRLGRNTTFMTHDLEAEPPTAPFDRFESIPL